MAAVYTVHTSVIRIFNCLYCLNVTIKSYWKWWADAFSASQIDCTPLDSQISAGKNRTFCASSVFFNRQLGSRCKVWKYTPFPDYARVHCGRLRIYPGVDPELFPRGKLRWLPESSSPSQDLPPLLWLCEVYSAPRIDPSLPESTPPPFSTSICDPPRIYPSLPEHTPLFNNYNRPSQNRPFPPRIYPPPLFNIYMRSSQDLPFLPRTYPPF